MNAMRKNYTIFLLIIGIVLISICGCRNTHYGVSEGTYEGEPAAEETKEWSVQEISSLFYDNSELDWKMVECVSAYDFAYECVGVILYTESDEEYINVAFMDKEGGMQHCGIEAVLGENAEFAYHGNGEVTFNVCTKDGFKYKQKIIFSKNDDGVNFVSEAVDFEAKHIVIDLSASKESLIAGDVVAPLKLKILSEEKNDIDWANEWYDNENLMLPMIGDEWNHFYDEIHEYQWVGDQLEIYEKETGHCLYVLEYPTDKWYVNGNNACLKDGIFYGASVTNGYAQPDTCFMFAYDLKNDELLWRSADQSYNTMNFIVKDDIIICGYGFTDEKDYLYQINRNTGEIIDKIELKKKPDLLIEQDGKFYVHTYSYNYVLGIEE